MSRPSFCGGASPSVHGSELFCRFMLDLALFIEWQGQPHVAAWMRDSVRRIDAGHQGAEPDGKGERSHACR
jgi:hypothetical protein